jgi:hypothetical protein
LVAVAVKVTDVPEHIAPVGACAMETVGVTTAITPRATVLLVAVGADKHEALLVIVQTT